MDKFKGALLEVSGFVYRQGEDSKTIALNTDNRKRLELLMECVEERELYDKVIDILCGCLEEFDASYHSEPHWSKKQWRNNTINIVKREREEKKNG